MNKHNEVTLKEAINKLIDTYKLRGKMNEAKLINSWEKIFGKTIAKYTSNLYIKDKKLFVKVESAPLKQEFVYHKQKMIKSINEYIGDEMISDIIIR